MFSFVSTCAFSHQTIFSWLIAFLIVTSTRPQSIPVPTLALFLVSTGVTHVPIFFLGKDVPILFSCIVHLRRRTSIVVSIMYVVSSPLISTIVFTDDGIIFLSSFPLVIRSGEKLASYET